MALLHMSDGDGSLLLLLITSQGPGSSTCLAHSHDGQESGPVRISGHDTEIIARNNLFIVSVLGVFLPSSILFLQAQRHPSVVRVALSLQGIFL